MGLLSGIKRRARNGSLFDSFAAAQATLAGDYGAAAQIYGAGRKRRADQAEQKQEEEARRRLEATIDADPTLSPQDRAYAKANPKAYIEQYMTRFQTRQFGAAGGSMSTPGAGGQPNFVMAPSRHEFQGSVFDVGGGVPGAPATVTPQQQGTQWITPQPGTRAFGVNSFTGQRRTPQDIGGGAVAPPVAMGPPASAPRIGAPPASPAVTVFRPGQVVNGYRFKGGDDTDENNWEPVQGGAGSRGPRTFPGVPY